MAWLHFIGLDMHKTLNFTIWFPLDHYCLINSKTQRLAAILRGIKQCDLGSTQLLHNEK